MAQTRHPDHPPDVGRLLAALNGHGVRYVLVGSVAAQVYGAEVQPGDLDITPAPDRENLVRLCELLQVLEATLPDTDDVGHWQVQPDGEKKWNSRQTTPEDRLARARWQPDPDDLSTLDHLMHTRHGNLDVVPDLTGDYEMLMKRAVRMETHGQEIWVVHVDELLTALTIPRRKKDVPRVRQLRQIQRQRGEANERETRDGA